MIYTAQLTLHWPCVILLNMALYTLLPVIWYLFHNRIRGGSLLARATLPLLPSWPTWT